MLNDFYDGSGCKLFVCKRQGQRRNIMEFRRRNFSILYRQQLDLPNFIITKNWEEGMVESASCHVNLST